MEKTSNNNPNVSQRPPFGYHKGMHSTYYQQNAFGEGLDRDYLFDATYFAQQDVNKLEAFLQAQPKELTAEEQRYLDGLRRINGSAPVSNIITLPQNLEQKTSRRNYAMAASLAAACLITATSFGCKRGPTPEEPVTQSPPTNSNVHGYGIDPSSPPYTPSTLPTIKDADTNTGSGVRSQPVEEYLVSLAQNLAHERALRAEAVSNIVYLRAELASANSRYAATTNEIALAQSSSLDYSNKWHAVNTKLSQQPQSLARQMDSDISTLMNSHVMAHQPTYPVIYGPVVFDDKKGRFNDPRAAEYIGPGNVNSVQAFTNFVHNIAAIYNPAIVDRNAFGRFAEEAGFSGGAALDNLLTRYEGNDTNPTDYDKFAQFLFNMRENKGRVFYTNSTGETYGIVGSRVPAALSAPYRKDNYVQ